MGPISHRKKSRHHAGIQKLKLDQDFLDRPHPLSKNKSSLKRGFLDFSVGNRSKVPLSHMYTHKYLCSCSQEKKKAQTTYFVSCRLILLNEQSFAAKINSIFILLGLTYSQRRFRSTCLLIPFLLSFFPPPSTALPCFSTIYFPCHM